MLCNNKSQCHDLSIVTDGDSAQRVVCKLCKANIVIRKDVVKGVPERRQYARIFKRDILQGGDNLFYKYHPEFIRT